jgi:hypothetical protein
LDLKYRNSIKLWGVWLKLKRWQRIGVCCVVTYEESIIEDEGVLCCIVLYYGVVVGVSDWWE